MKKNLWKSCKSNFSYNSHDNKDQLSVTKLKKIVQTVIN